MTIKELEQRIKELKETGTINDNTEIFFGHKPRMSVDYFLVPDIKTIILNQEWF